MRRGYSTIAAESIVLIAAIVAAGIISIALLSRAGDLASTISASAREVSEEAIVKIKIVHATLAGSQPNLYNYTVYVKNVGFTPISNLENLDVYFGAYGTPRYIPYSTSSVPGWYYVEVEGNRTGLWEIQETIALVVLVSTPPSNPMYVKVVTPQGVSDSYLFNVEV